MYFNCYTTREDDRYAVESFLRLFRDPEKALENTGGQLKVSVQQLITELNADDKVREDFERTMGYLIKFIDLYFGCGEEINERTTF